MLRISKLTDYATVILSYLALDSSKIMSATGIAKIVHINVPTVSKILKILTENGLVNSFRGTGGGYQLSRPAHAITLADVVSAIEGKVAMTECCAPNKACVLDSLCAIKENWQVINNLIMTTLSGLTLKDMAKPLEPSHTRTLRGIPIKAEGLNQHGWTQPGEVLK